MRAARTGLAWLLFAACTDVRPPVRAPLCPDWREEVAPLLAQECAGCHGAAAAAASYRVDSYGAAVATDGTQLLERIGGAGNHPVAGEETRALLERWIDDCGASYFASDTIHPRGFVNPNDPAFHGAKLRASGWELEQCERCHGGMDDPSGGPSGRSCINCHTQGVGACNTCHGDAATPAPDTGAHRAHVLGGSRLGVAVECQSCHRVPASWRDAGHIFTANGNLDGSPAEVIVAYDRSSGSCGVACHGEAGSPPWSGAPSDGCTLCHAMPPEAAAHASWIGAGDCATCHARVVDATPAIIDASRHIDGAVSVGDESSTCAACHSLPPVGGAHVAHTSGGRFGSPLGCGECHGLPGGADFISAVLTTGHIDSAAPAEVLSGLGDILAAADGAAASFDAGSGSCAVYCHGGGQTLSADSAAGLAQEPIWSGAVDCGDCHGLPPETPGHPNQFSEPCGVCHRETVDAAGQLIFDATGETLHINGAIDF